MGSIGLKVFDIWQLSNLFLRTVGTFGKDYKSYKALVHIWTSVM